MKKLKVLYNVASLSLAALLLLGAGGCSGDNTNTGDKTPTECNPADCTEIPDSFCEGDDLVVYTAGCSEDNKCEYTTETTTCANGCQDSECVPDTDVGVDLCEDVECDPPTAPACDVTVVVSYAEGVCNSETGECDYAETRTDCADDGKICKNGQCVNKPACEDVVCDTPPEPTCQNNVRITYEATGQCITATGECRYRETSVNCAVNSMVCQSGECVDLCDNVPCSTPGPAYCNEAGNAVTLRTEGQCQWDTGECRYLPQTEHDCSALQQVCSEGVCQNLCSGNTCNTPPEPYCDGQGKAVTYASIGMCNWRNGDCTYTSQSTNCADYGKVCSAGACVNLCDGVTCNTPPEDGCESNTLVTWEAAGECNWTTGLCVYEETATDCAANLQVCENTACVDKCADQPCNTPDPSFCDGTVAVTWNQQGTCDWMTGLCGYEEASRDDCSASETVCQDGICSNKCADVVCDNAPVAFCEGNTLIFYEVPGECVWQSGECFYLPMQENCEDSQMVCNPGDGESNAFCMDLCADYEAGILTCEQTPADPYCDGNNLIIDVPLGTCDWVTGECVFVPESYDCTGDYAVCDSGVNSCVNLCDGVICDQGPNTLCADADTLEYYEGSCSWEDGSCTYDPIQVSCTDVVPDDFCYGDWAVTYANLGCMVDEFDEALVDCSYTETATDCTLDGGICFSGACYGVEPCTPCETDIDCGGEKDLCIEQLDGKFCAPNCSETSICPDGYTCTLVDEATNANVCVPDREYCIDADCALDTDCDHPVCSLWDVCQAAYNSDFEDWTRNDPPRGYLKLTPSVWTVEQENETVNTGSSAAKVDASGSTTATRDLFSSPYYFLPVTAGTKYTFHAWYNYTRPDEETRWVKTGMSYYFDNKIDKVGTTSFINQNGVSLSTNGWKELVFATIAPEEAAWLELVYRSKGTVSYIDDWAVTVAKSFDPTDGILDDGTFQVGTGANEDEILNVAINNQGILYMGTNKASYANGSDRVAFAWLNGTCYCPTPMPWQKTSELPGASFDNGSLFALLQRESMDGTFTCQWQKYTDLGWLAITEGTTCGDGANGDVLEGTLDLTTALGVSAHYGSLMASIPGAFNFAAYDVETADGGKIMTTGAIPADSIIIDEENGNVFGIDFDKTVGTHRVNFLAGKIN